MTKDAPLALYELWNPTRLLWPRGYEFRPPPGPPVLVPVRIAR